jgi:malyl-CoA/(S)-citramalyl-CoA lyase
MVHLQASGIESGGSYHMVEAAVAQAKRKGAVSLDERLIDDASIRQAEVLVEKARQIAGVG